MSTRYGDEEGMGPMEKGRNRYQKKHYAGALQAFTEAVRMSTGHMLLTALDHRAATYEKLEQLQPALKDAKQMIELKPELSKGYLRCGKVLQLKGERELALKIYERGLKKVKVGTDEERVKLQAMFSKLQNLQEPRKCLDPLTYLPLELAQMITEELSMRDRVICLAVSKSWKRLLESSHKLWTTLDTSCAKRQLSQKALRAHVKRSNYTIDRVITSQAGIDAQRLQYLTKYCKKLQYLKICYSGLIGETLLSALPMANNLAHLELSSVCSIKLTAVIDALNMVKDTIEVARFYHVTGARIRNAVWPRLEALKDLHLTAYEDSGQIYNLLDVIPNIETLSLFAFELRGSEMDLTHLRKLQNLELVNAALPAHPKFPETIKSLDLTSLSCAERVDLEMKLPLLESFSCQHSAVSTIAVQTIMKSAINLKQAKIGFRYDEPATAATFPRCQSLEELSLQASLYEEADLIDITTKCPKLQSLNLDDTYITGVAVKHFVGLGIKKLSLNRCNGVSFDAVEYARSKGVQVQYSFRDRYAL
ncbi:f-box domain protein [Rutstroemia sp. NJR-2017a WRK4]|nr:f-box domain protein [Rutstroemia sp. NJR-2017a WRK4]